MRRVFRVCIMLVLIMTLALLTACGGQKISDEELAEDIRSGAGIYSDNIDKLTVLENETNKDEHTNTLLIELETGNDYEKALRYYELCYSSEKTGDKRELLYCEPVREDEWKEWPLVPAEDEWFGDWLLSALSEQGYKLDISGTEISAEMLELKSQEIAERETLLDESTDSAVVKLCFSAGSLDISGAFRVKLTFSDMSWKFDSFELSEEFTVPDGFFANVPKPTGDEMIAKLEGNQFRLDEPPQSDDPYDVQAAQVFTIRKENFVDYAVEGEPRLCSDGDVAYDGTVKIGSGLGVFDVGFSAYYSRGEDGGWSLVDIVPDVQYRKKEWALCGAYAGRYVNSTAYLVITGQSEDGNVKGTLAVKGRDNYTNNIYYMEGALLPGDQLEMHSVDAFYTDVLSEKADIRVKLDFGNAQMVNPPDFQYTVSLKKSSEPPDELRLIHKMDVFSNLQLHKLRPDKYYDFMKLMRETYGYDVLLMPEAVFDPAATETPEDQLTGLYRALDLGFDEKDSGMIICHGSGGLRFICVGECAEKIPAEIQEDITGYAETIGNIYTGSAQPVITDAVMEAMMKTIENYLAEGKLIYG